MTTKPELKGPIRGVRFIHRAILTEAQDFEKSASSLASDDINGAAALQERLAAFDRVLKLHEDGEDLTLFPALQERFPHIAATYEYDHKNHRGHGRELESTLAELGTARGGRRSELTRLLGQQAAIFNAFMNLHIDKEDLLLFPTYDKAFSTEEQQAHGAAAEGKIDQQAMAVAGVWAFQRLDTDDREGFLRMMMTMVPPQALTGMTKGFSGAVADPEWQEILRRVPELSA